MLVNSPDNYNYSTITKIAPVFQVRRMAILECYRSLIERELNVLEFKGSVFRHTEKTCSDWSI